jgi:hypothetical protein
MWPYVVTNFFIIKPTRWHETLHVSDNSSVHHQEFIHCTLSNGICHTAFEQDQDGTPVPPWSCSKAVYKPVWHIPLLSVQWINSWWWTEELSETCRISCQNKFVRLVYLVGFIIKKPSLCCVGPRSGPDAWEKIEGSSALAGNRIMIRRWPVRTPGTVPTVLIRQRSRRRRRALSRKILRKPDVRMWHVSK